MKVWERILQPHMQRLNMRAPIHYLYKHGSGEKLIGLELGCDEGFNARNILSMLNIQHLYLIDLVEKPEVYHNLKRWQDKVTVLYGDSIELVIADRVPDVLDFCYIDTAHTYETTRKEIELYYPKVKSGGVFGGHDFCSYWRGVAKAVNEFCDDNGYELERFANKFCIDWYIIKK